MFNVIIVDDEKYGIIDLMKTMKWENYDFIVKNTFVNSIEAYHNILTYLPDVVFTDIKMPHMDGIELIKKCRESGYQGEFVIVSSYDDFVYAKSAIRYRVEDYCLKPLNDDEANEVLFRLAKRLDATRNNKMETLVSDDRLVNQITEYIKINLQKKLTLESICSEFHISTSYCCKIFKKEFDESLLSYILNQRLLKAKHFLIQSEKPINEISKICGFDDYFYFAKRFRHVEGCTPTEYRLKVGKCNEKTREV